jgi:hypothetical protein
MSRHRSLIINDPKTVSMNWDFDGAEIDLLSKAIKGKKQEIAVEVIQNFVQGIVESLIVKQLSSDEDHRAHMVASLISNGKTDEYISSYLRGWDAVGNSILDSNEVTT